MNVVVNVNQNLARIFILHAIGTSLALWVFTIIRETADAIAKSDAERSGKMAQRNQDFIKFSLKRKCVFQFTAKSRIARENETFEFVYNDCGKSNALNAVHRQFAPYLYPFVIEYCILVVGIWCKIYANINHCPRKNVNTNATISQDGTSDSMHLNFSRIVFISKIFGKDYYFFNNT